MKRTMAIGDIHGHYEKLIEMLNTIDDKNVHRIVFVGDYIDRGPDSFKVIDHLCKLQDEDPDRYIFLMGNHEHMMMFSHEFRYIFDTWVLGGAMDTINSYKKEMNCKFRDGFNIHLLPERHQKFFNDLKLYFEDENYIYVHAGLSDEPFKDQDHDDMLWIRETFILSEYDWGKKVIFGHSSFNDPFKRDNKIGIDTGCGYGSQLTSVDLPLEVFHQV